MTKQEEKACGFDFVHDGQRVFRSLMKAMSNPGTIQDIGEQAEKFGEGYAPLTAVGCTLLDNEEIAYVGKNPVLSSELHDLTLCRRGALEEADFIFLSSEMNYGSLEQILRNVKKGSYSDPQDSATLVILCGEIRGDVPVTVKGPGVNGALTIRVSKYLETILFLRQSLDIEYPLGTDLIFVTPEGEIICFPRLCRAEK